MMNTLAIALMTLTITGHQTDTPRGLLVIERASVKPIRSIQVPARQAGPISEIFVEENQLVVEGALLAKLDDAETLIRKLAAEGELNAARAQAEEDVEVATAKAAHGVARAEVDDSIRVNALAPGAIAGTELRRQELTEQRAGAQVKVEEVNFAVAKLTVSIREQQLALVNHELAERQIKAPWAGLIEKVIGEEGAWVQPGDPVVNVVQMDRLRVDAFVKADDVAPYELIGKTAEITISLPNGRKEKVIGKVDYASQVEVSSKDFHIWIEFDNVRVPLPESTKDSAVYFLYRPGMAAKVEIRMDDSQF
ncbi:MAG TPA: HlyD family efflux transporter periplasmic adaptor subunit [Planctomycetaceae bacterium]|nr:HlyD family efflux transporter periplasmic adaptor subunit [Planctomycetaceae bacterium]